MTSGAKTIDLRNVIEKLYGGMKKSPPTHFRILPSNFGDNNTFFAKNRYFLNILHVVTSGDLFIGLT